MSVNRNVTVPVGNDGVEALACVVEVIESWSDRRGEFVYLARGLLGTKTITRMRRYKDR
jgi:hypothetical protein